MNTEALPCQVLILPGWQNSGPQHWQSLWQTAFGYQRVEQHDWLRPLRGDWITRLEEVLLAQPGPAILVAHSLGCQLVAAWAACSSNTARVAGALLVAPGDPQREELRPILNSWCPLALKSLPFKSILVASRDDPYCSFERTQFFANAWAARLVDVGCCGHINADSGLGQWLQGRELLQSLINQLGTELKVCPASAI